MKGSLMLTITSLLILSACQKQPDSLTSVEHVSQWTAQAREQAKDNVHLPEQAATTQLFSSELPSSLNKQAFIASNKSAAKAKTTEQKNLDEMTSLITEEATSLPESPLERPQQNIKPHVPTLSQATLREINYQGVLHQNGGTWGVVRVGDRLYRVSLHEHIGKESWAVTQLTEQNLQLSANGKTHTVTKGQLEH